MLDLNVMKHGRTTNLQAGVINNLDAFLILLDSGLTKRKDLIAGMDAWRKLNCKSPARGYLFNLREATKLEGADRLAGQATYRRTAKGTYGLTEAGRNRLDNLQA